MRPRNQPHRRKKSCLLGGKPENCVGYCHYHKCTVTLRQMKNRKCLLKQCPRLQRYENHPYWKQRERAKEAKRKRKEAMTNDTDGLRAVPAPEDRV